MMLYNSRLVTTVTVPVVCSDLVLWELGRLLKCRHLSDRNGLFVLCLLVLLRLSALNIVILLLGLFGIFGWILYE